MNRQSEQSYAIAHLATGDEICNGDILNTNAQHISQKLFPNGMMVTSHMAVPDNIQHIEHAIHYLLQHHRAIIITGGLGPTSDDLTRIALANVVARPLQFDEESWQYIVDRLAKFGLGTPPECNRQQALFPAGATIIKNIHGTAAGCMLEYEQHFIFMLPGPPGECLPMIDSKVLPTLLQAGFKQLHFHHAWLLFSVSEGHIAEVLDEIAKPYDCITGYRICYPYLEFKILMRDEKDFLALKEKITAAIATHLINDGQKTASQQLREKLTNFTGKLVIADFATGGLLENILQTPETFQHLVFTQQEADIEIFGLEEFWQQREKQTTQIILNFKGEKISAEIPFRGERVKLYAVEWICKMILTYDL